MKPHARPALFRVAVGVVAIGLLGAGCAGDDGGLPGGPSVAGNASAGGDDGPLVVATTSIVGDVAANVVGDEGRVAVLMPAGIDPHGFRPSARDAARLREADLVVAIGLGLEAHLVDPIEAAEADGVPVLRLAEQLDPIPYADDHEAVPSAPGDDHTEVEHAADDGHGHGPLDPHVWFDPARMADGAELMAARLAAVADGDWQTRGDAYAEQLRDVDADLADRFGALPPDARRLVTNHDSLGYLAHRYDFEILGTVVPGSSAAAETDARAFAALVETIDDAGVDAIFTENIEDAELAEQLASEVGDRGGDGVAVVSLYTDALGPPGSGAETYVDLLRENGRRIVEALA